MKGLSGNTGSMPAVSPDQLSHNSVGSAFLYATVIRSHDQSIAFADLHLYLYHKNSILHDHAAVNIAGYIFDDHIQMKR